MLTPRARPRRKSSRLAAGPLFVRSISATVSRRSDGSPTRRANWAGHILVNNAGVAKSEPFLEVSRENWESHLRVHLSGAFYPSQAAAREMARRKYGRIVSMASVAGLMGPLDLAPYGVAKSGIIALTRAMAFELADHGITANAIAPGPIDTEIGACGMAQGGLRGARQSQSDQSLRTSRRSRARGSVPGPRPIHRTFRARCW